MESRDRLRRRTVVLAAGSLVAVLAGCFGSETEPASFTVTAESPEMAIVGEEVTIVWEVTNEGDKEDTQAVVFSVDEEQRESEEVTLAAGESDSGEFTVVPNSEGALPATVATDDDEASTAVLVEAP